MDANTDALPTILTEIHACQVCAAHLPLNPRPVLQASATARVAIISQAPGIRAHNSGIPFDDPSGDRLRDWMGVDKSTFYDHARIAIVPMGFCYPGKGKSGDLPPRKECAPLWHERLLAQLPALQLRVFVGRYAQQEYLGQDGHTLTERVRSWQNYAPDTYVLPHPSPRNRYWLDKNPWFEAGVLPAFHARLRVVLAA